MTNFEKQAEAARAIMPTIAAEADVLAASFGLDHRTEIGGSVTYSMSQRRRAEQILEKLRLLPEDEMRRLHDVLGDAQNAPPLGEADGSINEEAFNALREVETSLRKLGPAIETFKRSLS